LKAGKGGSGGTLTGEVGLEPFTDEADLALFVGDAGVDLVFLGPPSSTSGLVCFILLRSRSVIFAAAGSAFFRVRGAGTWTTPNVASSVGRSVKARAIQGSDVEAGAVEVGAETRGLRLVLSVTDSS
jgi:hypothetical protein